MFTGPKDIAGLDAGAFYWISNKQVGGNRVLR